MSRLKSVFLLTVILVSLVYGQFPNRLAMYAEQGRTLPDECDFVVVGTGAAGSVLAKRLSSSRLSVCVLEAGGPDDNLIVKAPLLFGAVSLTPLDWNYYSVPQAGLGGRQSYLPRGKMLGGTTSRNAMIYVRSPKEEYDEWGRDSHGWSWRDVLPYFKRTERNMNTNLNQQFHNFGGEWILDELTYRHNTTTYAINAHLEAGVFPDSDFADGTLTGVRANQVFIRYGQRASLAEAMLTPDVINRTNLFIQTFAHATKINMDGKKAKSVTFNQLLFNPDGSVNGTVVKTVRARKAVVSAAGTYGSAQLLLLSGIGPKEDLEALNIPVVSDVPVGRAIADHNMVGVTVELTPDADSFDEDVAGSNLLVNIGKWFETLGTPASRQGSPIASNVPEAAAFHKISGKTGPLDYWQTLVAPGMFAKDGFLSVTSLNATKSLTIGVVNMRPKARGTIKLSSTNPLDAPLIDHNYLGSEEDINLLLEGINKTRFILSRPSIAVHTVRELLPGPSCVSRECLVQYLKDYLMSGYHPMSSSPMGKKTDPFAVVDNKLKVYGTQNLYVIDGSVTPDVPRSNPTSTIVMLAEKGSDILLDRYDGEDA